MMECCAFHNYGWCAILKHISKLKSSLLNVTNGIRYIGPSKTVKAVKEILPHEVCCKDHKRCKRFLHFLHVSIVSFGWFCNWSKLFLRAYLLTENWKKIFLWLLCIWNFFKNQCVFICIYSIFRIYIQMKWWKIVLLL